MQFTVKLLDSVNDFNNTAVLMLFLLLRIVFLLFTFFFFFGDYFVHSQIRA